MFIESYFSVRPELAILLEIVISSGLIFFFGKRLIREAESFGDISRQSNTWFGMAFLAFFSVLPEISITLSTLCCNPASISANLVTGTLLGSSSFILILILFLNLFQGSQPLFFYTHRSLTLAASYTLILMGLLALGFFSALNFGNRPFFHQIPMLANLISLGIPLFFFIGIYTVFSHGIQEQKKPKLPATHLPNLSTNLLCLFSYGGALALSGVWLAQLGVKLSNFPFSFHGKTLVLGEIMVGTFLLGFLVVLPKIGFSVSFLLARRVDLALIILFGGILWNQFFLVICDSMIQGSLYYMIGQQHLISAIVGMLFIAIVISSFIAPSKKSLLRVGTELFLTFLLIVFWFFVLGHISMQNSV